MLFAEAVRLRGKHMKAVLTDVKIPSGYYDNGLPDLHLKGLREIVAFAGPNGAGKSRILNKIQAIAAMHTNRRTYTGNLQRQKEALIGINKAIEAEQDEGAKEVRLHRKSIIEGKIREFQRNIENLPTVEGDTSKLEFLRFDGRSVILEPVGSLTDAEFAKIGSRKHGLLAISSKDAARILAAVHRRYLSTLLPNNGFAKSGDENTRFEALQNLIRTLLKTEITNRGLETHLFGHPLDHAKLSDGQRRLLQFCVGLFEYKAEQRDIIVLLDEPESHLHPEAIIQIVERLKQALPEGQIFIATHSVTLLAHLGPEFIWSVEKGEAKRAGRDTREILVTLMGGEDNVQRMANFLAEPFQMAANIFAWESLSPPAVARYKDRDPQASQILSGLGLSEDNKPLRLLDIGAGRGRLIETIHAWAEENGRPVESVVDYSAFDISSEHKGDCEAAIARAYGKVGQRYIAASADLHRLAADQRFSVAVMCNVLHEIPPSSWTRVFSDLSQILESSGVVLIIEDLQIPHGELAHQGGFIILDQQGIKKLFAATAEVTEIHPPSGYEGRLAGYLIAASQLTHVKPETIKAALEWTREHAKRKIYDLRQAAGKNIAFRDGLTHSLYCQQVVNAGIALEDFGA